MAQEDIQSHLFCFLVFKKKVGLRSSGILDSFYSNTQTNLDSYSLWQVGPMVQQDTK